MRNLRRCERVIAIVCFVQIVQTMLRCHSAQVIVRSTPSSMPTLSIASTDISFMVRIHFVQLVSKVVPQAFRKRFGFDRPLQHCGIRPSGVEMNDVIYTDAGFISLQTLDPVSGLNLFFAQNCETESGVTR